MHSIRYVAAQTMLACIAVSIAGVRAQSISLQSATDSLIATYDQIDSYQANAEIVKKNPCNVSRTNGTYCYHKPESASVVIGSDTFTTLDLRGCASVLEGFSILVAPVLSSEPIKRMRQAELQLADSANDTLQLILVVDSTTFKYFVEKERWIIASIQCTGKEPFHADYYYDYYEGLGNIPVLTMVAINGDTTLDQGGYSFSNIQINGQLSAQQQKLHKPASHFSVTCCKDGFGITFAEPYPAARKLVIENMLGRTVFADIVAPYATRYSSVAGWPVLSPGIYAVHVVDALQVVSATFSVIE